MGESLLFALSLSILPAAVIGAIRLAKIDRIFYPFIILCWLAVLAEVLSILNETLIVQNIYVLLESLLLTWQFRKWGSFEHPAGLYFVMLSFFAAVWVAESFFIRNIFELSSYFRIIASLLITIFAVDQINKMIVRERKSLISNSKFLICGALILYFSYKVMVEIFYLYALNLSQDFLRRVFDIQVYINVIANLIYAYAILKAWTTKSFLTRY